MQIVLALFLCMAAVATAMYSSKSNVVEGTAANFKDEVLKHNGIVMVEFYAPW